ncbi:MULTISPECIES: SCP2 sterol-binding domain-containing protein [Micromonospora]|uniref:SCP2 sterol-binding domain-containing protein n=1 Tax=Micromonospora zamorensis TaxID=709883 RepID=A0ABZ1PF66_9ACTN|nr:MULTISPECIES: SCP2 sterol-binding domain-containing protein [Micromonospora]MBQ0977767.1 SCP2 sterol-binding domain-containing protein [Micromonospora sp. M61]MBQ1040041.1 SCP2 sterol-binding domain-containing protein [Micromonospora sp. C81]TQJ24690.1 SCP-2 sterol transfer family protein [Micromonospora sp. A202]WSK50749.1 SCP2 sterol-binding domain-containing protein [Micromonospora zamorensis]WTI21472.1 SCP2 sterol-binding domain-containing protein [Micromonospora zamorensis]
MVDATTRFFEDLDRRGYEPLLAKTSGTVRIDLHEGAQTRHWLLRIDHGRLDVSQEDQEADTVIGTSPVLFDDIASGREHGLAALLRGDMTVSGDARLVVQVERIFPGSPDARGPRRRFVGEAD